VLADIEHMPCPQPYEDITDAKEPKTRTAQKGAYYYRDNSQDVSVLFEQNTNQANSLLNPTGWNLLSLEIRCVK